MRVKISGKKTPDDFFVDILHFLHYKRDFVRTERIWKIMSEIAKISGKLICMVCKNKVAYYNEQFHCKKCGIVSEEFVKREELSFSSLNFLVKKKE